MRKSCGKTAGNFIFHNSAAPVGDQISFHHTDESVLVFQVGDHHPDLYVWNLYNHHEVSLFLLLSHFSAVSAKPSLKTQCLCVCCVFVGSTDPCVAW